MRAAFRSSSFCTPFPSQKPSWLNEAWARSDFRASVYRLIVSFSSGTSHFKRALCKDRFSVPDPWRALCLRENRQIPRDPRVCITWAVCRISLIAVTCSERRASVSFEIRHRVYDRPATIRDAGAIVRKTK